MRLSPPLLGPCVELDLKLGFRDLHSHVGKQLNPVRVKPMALTTITPALTRPDGLHRLDSEPHPGWGCWPDAVHRISAVARSGVNALAVALPNVPGGRVFSTRRMRGVVLIGAVVMVVSSACGSAPSGNATATTTISRSQVTASPAVTAIHGAPKSSAPHPLAPAGNELNNREWASVFWLGVILLSLIVWRQTRSTLLGLIRSVASAWIIWLVFAVLLAWTAVLVMGAYRLHIWTTGLIKDTILWCGSPALALFFSLTDASRRRYFFRRAAAATLGLAPFLEFYLNLYIFPLAVELIFQPVIAILALSGVVPTDARNRAGKMVATGLLSVIGLAVIVFSTVSLIENWQKTDWPDTLRRLILPVWLTLGVLPCLYGISLVFNYQQAFRLLRWASPDPMAISRARLALLVGLNGRTRMVGNFDGGWAARLTAASSFRDARRIVREYQTSMRS